jgi:hypothetical protein
LDFGPSDGTGASSIEADFEMKFFRLLKNPFENDNDNNIITISLDSSISLFLCPGN